MATEKDNKVIYGEGAREEAKKHGEPVLRIEIYDKGEEEGVLIDKKGDASEDFVQNALVAICAEYGLLCIPADGLKCIGIGIIDCIIPKKSDKTSDTTVQ